MSNRICLFAVLLSCSLKAILGEKSTACSQRTVDNHCCRFPFYYKGIRYRSCTYHGDIHNRFWCATEDFKYSRNVSTSWGYCKLIDSQCFVKTTDGDCCIFPFKYRGKEYENCAATEDNPEGLYWCATKSEFDGSVNGSGWGYCAGTKCFSCQSTISWDHCNTHKVEKTCPFRFEHCATFNKEETHDSEKNSNQANNTTKIFAKDCALGSECSKPGSHCNEQSSVTESCSYGCCHGHLCNGGTHSTASPHGSLAFLFSIVLAIIFSSRTSEARRKRKNCESGKQALLQS